MRRHDLTARRVFRLSFRTFTPLTPSTAQLLQAHLNESSLLSSSSNLQYYSKLNARVAQSSVYDEDDYDDYNYKNEAAYSNKFSNQTQTQTISMNNAIKVEQRHPWMVLNANNTNLKVSENETLNRVNNVTTTNTTPSNNTNINNNNKNNKDSKPTLEQLLHLKQVLANFVSNNFTILIGF